MQFRPIQCNWNRIGVILDEICPMSNSRFTLASKFLAALSQFWIRVEDSP